MLVSVCILTSDNRIKLQMNKQEAIVNENE